MPPNNVFIEIIPSVKEKRVPLIKLSKSKNGQTGTATFLFIKPKCFKQLFFLNSTISSVKLIGKKYEISSKKIDIFFKNGKPFFLKTLFLFIAKQDYFFLLRFINLYAKENKLIYF